MSHSFTARHPKLRLRRLSVGVLLLFWGSSLTGAHVAPTTFGWVETVLLETHGLQLQAKLDTGARTTSLDARQVHIFKRDGADWVRFVLPRAKNKNQEQTTVEYPVTRFTRIKRHGGGHSRRPVITLSLCLGNIKKTVQVNLVDRSHFNYPVLLGRNFLKPDIVVDSGQTYLSLPMCGDSPQ